MASIDILESDIANAKSEIKKTKKLLKAANEKKDAQHEGMKARIQYLYENGQSLSFLSYLLSADDLEDFLNRVSYTQDLSQYDRDQLLVYEESIREIEKIQSDLENSKSILEEEKNNLDEQHVALESLLSEKKEQSKNYKAEVEALRVRADELSAQIAAQNAELQRIEEEKRLEEERRRKAEEEERRRQAEEAERKRQESEAAEKARLESEAAEKARLEAEAAAEKARLEAEAAAEKARQEAEAAEKAKKEAEEKARKKAEKAAKEAAEKAAKEAAEAERARKEAEEAAQRAAEEEAARQAAAEEAARQAAAEEAARQAAEEAARQAAAQSSAAAVADSSVAPTATPVPATPTPTPTTAPQTTGAYSDGRALGAAARGNAFYQSTGCMYQTNEKPGPDPAYATNNASIGVQIADFAVRYNGIPYRTGGTNLNDACDCSGFVTGVYRNFGVDLNGDPWMQMKFGREVSLAEIQPGDIVIYAGHSALYIGNNTIINASDYNVGVVIRTPVTYRQILTIRRIFG